MSEPHYYFLLFAIWMAPLAPSWPNWLLGILCLVMGMIRMYEIKNEGTDK